MTETNQLSRGCSSCRHSKPTFTYRHGVMQIFCQKKGVIVSEKSNCFYHPSNPLTSTEYVSTPAHAH